MDSCLSYLSLEYYYVFKILENKPNDVASSIDVLGSGLGYPIVFSAYLLFLQNINSLFWSVTPIALLYGPNCKKKNSEQK